MRARQNLVPTSCPTESNKGPGNCKAIDIQIHVLIIKQQKLLHEYIVIFHYLSLCCLS